jgi:hypothetical protein
MGMQYHSKFKLFIGRVYMNSTGTSVLLVSRALLVDQIISIAGEYTLKFPPRIVQVFCRDPLLSSSFVPTLSMQNQQQ